MGLDHETTPPLSEVCLGRAYAPMCFHAYPPSAVHDRERSAGGDAAHAHEHDSTLSAAAWCCAASYRSTRGRYAGIIPTRMRHRP